MEKIRPFQHAREDFYDYNILSVSVTTSGIRGGNGCKGGALTFIDIEDQGGTQWDIRPVHSDYGGLDKFKLTLSGDGELRTAIAAARWIADTLEKML